MALNNSKDWISTIVETKLIPLLLYMAIVTALTWPLIPNLNLNLIGDYADTRNVVWGIWTKIHTFELFGLQKMIGQPFDIPVTIRQLITEKLTFFLALFTNEVMGYNCFIIISLIMSAFIHYIYLLNLIRCKFSSFIGGIIFGFAPAVIMQAMGGHLIFVFNIFIPLFYFSLFYNRKIRNLVSASYVGLSFAGITLTSLYFGYFCIYIGLFFVAFDFLTCGAENRTKIVLTYLFSAVIAALLILPCVYLDILLQINTSSNVLLQNGQIRDLNELMVYSARLIEYFIPSIDHPLIGTLFETFVKRNLHGSNVPEQTLFLGYVPLGLFTTGLILVARKKLIKIHRTYFLFFAFGFLLTLFLSLPPIISLGQIKVPTISFFAYKIAPMFRVYSRFGILVNFFMSCAVTVVLAHLKSNMPVKKYFILIGLLTPLLLFEYWSISPNQIYNISKIPTVYKWLATEKEDFLIAEYPMMSANEVSFSNYLFWQRVHKKKMVNGASPGSTESWKFFQQVNDISNPVTLKLLASVGVKYVLIHKKVYIDGPISPPIKRYFNETIASATYNEGKVPPLPLGLKLAKSFGDDLVFTIVSDTFKGAM
jgi:hypothetical protein